MAASPFNIDMDRYLEKRSDFNGAISSGSSPSKEKKTKKQKGSMKRFVDAIKVLLDADEIIDSNHVYNATGSTVFQRKGFREKLLEVLKKEESTDKESLASKEDLDNGDNLISMDGKNKADASDAVVQVMVDNNKDNDKDNDISMKSSEGNDKSNTSFDSSVKSPSKDSSLKKPKKDSSASFIGNLFGKNDGQKDEKVSIENEISEEDRVPIDKVNDVIQESSLGSDTNSSMSEFREDLREIIKITYRIMRQVPPEAIREFKQSKEFKKYVDILDKYGLLRKRPENL